MMNQSITGSAKEDGATAMQSVISFVAPKQTEDKSRDIVLDDVQGIVSRVIAIARARGGIMWPSAVWQQTPLSPCDPTFHRRTY